MAQKHQSLTEEEHAQEKLLAKEPGANSNGIVIKKWRVGKTEIDLPLVALCLNNFLLNASTSVITPFYPPLATGSNPKYHVNLHLSSTAVGFVFSMNPIGGFIFGIVVSKFMQRLGRRNLMFISLIITIVSLIALGASYYLNEHPNWFLAVGLIARIFQGAARAGYGSTTFAYAPLLWPDQVKQKIGVLESCTGLGLMLGPFIGTGIFAAFSSDENYLHGWNYQAVFYIVSAAFAIFIVPSMRMLPAEDRAVQAKRPLSLGKVFFNVQILSLFLVLSASLLTYVYVLPLLTDYLIAGYGLSNDAAAIVTTPGTIAYMATMLLLPMLLKRVNNRVVLSVGLLVGAFSCSFLAPGHYLGLPYEWWTAAVGVFFAGIAQGCCMLPYIPEMMDIIVKLYGSDKEIKTLAGDMASGLLLSAYSFGSFLGPSIGGAINSGYGGTLGDPSSTVKTWCDKHASNFDGSQFDKLKDPCYAIRPFQFTSYMMAYIALLILLNYITVGRAYQGWVQLCSRRQSAHRALKIEEDPRKTAIREQLGVQPREREEGLSVMVMTDSEFENDIKPIRTMYAQMMAQSGGGNSGNGGGGKGGADDRDGDARANNARLYIQDKNSEYSEAVPFHKRSDFGDQGQGFVFGAGGRLGDKGLSEQQDVTSGGNDARQRRKSDAD